PKATAFAARPALKTVGRHQTRNAIEADQLTLVEQILIHARRANHAATVFMNLANSAQQTHILLSTRAGYAPLPSVITAGGNLQAAAHQPYRVLVAAAPDHLVPF